MYLNKKLRIKEQVAWRKWLD